MKRLFSIIIWILFFVPGIYLAISWSVIPEQVPMHYNMHGEVDRFGSKTELWVLVLILTAVNIGVYLLLSNVHKIDPKRHGIENRVRMKRMGQMIVIFITALICFFIYTAKNQTTRLEPNLIYSAVGLLFCILGNYMYNIKPNYFAGFRLPWTLENEENWKKTHILGGKLWFGGGLLIAVVSVFLNSPAAFIFMMCMVAILVIIPIAYSFRIYKNATSKN
jgi:uncharacterized membrane protein